MTYPYSQNPDERPLVAFAFEQLTVDNTAGGIGVTAPTAVGAKRALAIVETAQIRYTADGKNAPTSSVGMLANAGDQIILVGPEVQQFKAIRTGAASATLDMEYAR